jgi:hypothetical protein
VTAAQSIREVMAFGFVWGLMLLWLCIVVIAALHYVFGFQL